MQPERAVDLSFSYGRGRLASSTLESALNGVGEVELIEPAFLATMAS
jgi:hypothetical protein